MRRGFTLVEFLVVLVIICAVLLLLVPVLGKARARARVAQCVGNVRQVGIAMKRFELDHNEGWPHGRVSVHPEHPEWPDPTGSLASLYPEYVPRDYIFQCPATDDRVSLEPSGKDFLGCSNFYVSPEGVATRSEEQGKTPPTPPSYFYEAAWTDRINIPTDPPVKRVIYGDECVHGIGKDAKGEMYWLGENNHEGGGNFLFVDKHIEWLEVRWDGEPDQLGKGFPYVPNPHADILLTERGRESIEVVDGNVFMIDPKRSSLLDADLAGMMWVKDGWKEF